jgi:CubicO group peptidase (beta-lactamase class C family)
MKKNYTLIFLLPLFFCSCKKNSFNQNLEVASSLSFVQQVDSIIVNKMNQYNIPGLSIGLIKNDSVIYANGFGVRNIKTNDIVTENSIFHTASISKLFTALAIVQLIREDYLSLDSKLIELIPELNYSDEKVHEITIKNILNHTSGLPDVDDYNWENNNQSENSLKEYILRLNLNLQFDPSSEYQYSNLGYDILGYVVEKVSGSSFDDYVKENILNQVEMYNSDFRFFKILDSLKTSPHSRERVSGKIYVRKTYPYTREHGPSSTLNSSSKELSLWMITFLRSLNIQDSTNVYKQMIEPSFSSHPNIGLGFQLYDFDSTKAIGHYGGDKGFRSFLMMIPEKKIGLVVLANCDYKDDFRQEIVHSIAKLMLIE